MASEPTPMPQQLITQSAQATADAIASALTARTASISLPVYDWNSQDAYHSFSIFCHTLENWLFLSCILPDSEDHLRYVFAALGTESLEMHAQWMPNVKHQCETCTQFQSQKAAAPLTPTPTPSCLWQMCTTDIFTLEGIDHLVVGDFYLKMIFVQCLPPGQSNANKVISLLKEMFSEHGIPKVLCSDNGPQYASAQFTDFCMSWGISHETSSLHYPQSNGFAKACVKSAKHALQ